MEVGARDDDTSSLFISIGLRPFLIGRIVFIRICWILKASAAYKIPNRGPS